MLEPTNEQLKELHKDIMSGDVMTITTEHYKQQAEQIKELEAENKDLGDGVETVNNAGVKIRRNLEARIEELELAKSIGIQACGLLKERIEELEGAKTVETQVICGLVNCLQRNTKGECGHTSIHFQPCSDAANVAACSEYTE